MRRGWPLLLVLLATLGGSFGARAAQPGERLDDPVLERRARALSGELRCLVCQNQSIDDSDAPLAKDLRVIVRERLKAGDSNEAVRDFLAARYGQFVLLKPPFDGRTLLLWSSPLLALAAGGLAILVGRRRAHAAASVAGEALSPGEAAALSKLLTQGDNEGRPTSS